MTQEITRSLTEAVTSLGEAPDMAVYLAFGLLFALLPLVVPSAATSREKRELLPALHYFALGCTLVTCLVFVGQQFARISVPAAIVSEAIVVGMSERRSVVNLVSAFWPTLLAFHSTLLLLETPTNAETGQNAALLAVTLILSFGFLWAMLHAPSGRLTFVATLLAHVAFVVTTLIFVQTTVPMSLLPIGFQIHWGAIIGPVELIRDGGQVLYDVPLQYGLLNTLIVLVASNIVGDSWIGLQRVLQVFIGLNCLLLYGILGRLLAAVPMRYPLAATLTVGSLLLDQGLDCCLGTYISPAIGPYRFLPIWLIISYVIFLWDRLSDRRFVVIGCAIWLIGCAWSAEILIFSTALWFVCVAIRVSRVAGVGVMIWAFLKAVSLVLGAHALALAASLVLAGSGYAALYGHLPDLPRYFDFVLNIGDTGWFAVPAITYGATSVPVLVAALATIGLVRLARGGATPSEMSVATVTALGFWAASSYFVSRSLPIIVSYLPPYMVVSLLAVLRWPRDLRGAPAVMTMALCAAFVALPFSFAGGGRREVFEGALRSQPSVAEMLPWYAEPVGSIINGILQDHGESTIVLINVGEMPPEAAWPASVRTGISKPRWWLPVIPEAMLVPLPHRLRALYVERWVGRLPQPGWVVEQPQRPTGGLDVLDLAELSDYLAASHTVSIDITEGDYRIVRFEPR